ncbi:AbiV family abortive infection protein [Tenacibaculum sp. AHE15PA]|uniref:AbiV family abortive infection protein n=1 Tax=unclassified Tenacibaculum TaxID=2635139 RepID=UPI001C4EC47A|nr:MULTISPECIES: AbiV family abortive infection protein [unclassified Tenacibaculum]QXP74690.1 AbiV family abortive infection protein [Tenacibaculum sp. AHE14PA]QXP74708.1 AbiV family abortive infection protein [Tenacibaculum sp. AHE14PA]QXP76201.1 AbiV family abortive infection protein [Tenacibaculum sp. AHE15PA]QXP76219.1 AbiV family abortive infection protein [Tenacibaculum sp. AHE15PA]
MEKTYELINDSIKISSEKLIGFKSTEEFEKSLFHVKHLIKSSILLLENKFYNQSLFLTITAIEEIAKIEICVYRGFNERTKVNRRKDPLFNHYSKHKISANPIILIGERLKKSIGEDRLIEIFKNLQSGKFIEIRENCLYFERNNEKLIIPNEIIDEKKSYETLLIAIEMIDDKFWGLTELASKISDELNKYYSKIETELNQK